LALLVAQYGIGAEFNVIKLRTDGLKVSFLSYPDFFTDAHPALRHAIAVDLVTGRSRHTDYADNINPPILHRKESFIPADHPSRAEFEALTKQEEDAGLYQDTTTIGFKLNWDRLLRAKGWLWLGIRLSRGKQLAIQVDRLASSYIGIRPR
jgi:DNA phosphorothioation-associated putative methyltransferase